MMAERSQWLPKLRRVVLTLLIIYLVVCGIVMLAQRRMIYLPTRVNPAVAEKWGAGSQLQPWTNGVGQGIGWKRPVKEAVGQVLIIHGNAGCALDRDFYADKIQEVDRFNIFILEYPGYGSRGGHPSESTILAAAREAMGLLKGSGPLFVLGESLGTGAASYLAGTFPESVAGLVLIAPYNNFTAAAAAHMPLLPVRWLLWDKFPSDTYLKTYHGPLAILLAGHDEVIASALGRKLFDSYSGPKRVWEFPQATHNDVHSIDPNVWREVISFWREPSAAAKKVVAIKNQ